MTKDQQRPEGALIEAALKRRRISGRKAAELAGISDARWRQIVNGYQSAGAGQTISVVGPAETIARMAAVAGVTAAELRQAGRDDAAAEMASGITPDLAESAIGHITDQLEPRLAGFTDFELTREIQARMVLMAARLHAAGDDALVFVVDGESGDTVVTSRPNLGAS